jgi:hypothetical protein
MLIEKISYKINWRNFGHGYSFFIPCLDTTAAEEEILRVTKRLKLQVFIKICIEEDVKGLRVWRI